MAALVTWVGYMAGTFTTIASFPQLLHIWKTKHADDLHSGTLIIFAMGNASWLGYGIARRDLPLIVANAVTLMLQCAILVLKLRYAGSRAREARTN
jgi:MtN3 and saliva related transmembrane protein